MYSWCITTWKVNVAGSGYYTGQIAGEAASDAGMPQCTTLPEGKNVLLKRTI
jgi:hypothetical protein